jgi:hypothetical protein
LRAVLDEAAREPTGERHIARSRIESDAFTGSFKTVLIAAPGPRVRLQLIPELGPKLLDLVATPERLRVRWGALQDEDGAGPERLARMVGISLLENAQPLAFERILAARELEDGDLVELAPVVPGVGVRARLDARGQLVTRSYRDGVVRWQETLGAPHVFAGQGFLWHIEAAEQTPIPMPPASLFELTGATEVDG